MESPLKSFALALICTDELPLENLLFSALCEAIPQKAPSRQENLVWMATFTERYHFEMLGFKM